MDLVRRLCKDKYSGDVAASSAESRVELVTQGGGGDILISNP